MDLILAWSEPCTSCLPCAETAGGISVHAPATEAVQQRNRMLRVPGRFTKSELHAGRKMANAHAVPHDLK